MPPHLDFMPVARLLSPRPAETRFAIPLFIRVHELPGVYL